jgi:exo-beta-1,3-glucanase (GH17 family)
VVTQDQINERLAVVAPYTTAIRTYSATHGLDGVAAAARKLGLKTYIGAYITADSSANSAEMQSLISLAESGLVDVAIVGSEALYRGDVTPSQLGAYIDEFHAAVPNVPVVTADTDQMLSSNSQVVGKCDFVFFNYYPYWEGADVTKALSLLNIKYLRLSQAYPNLEIVVSETGWPSGGDTMGNAVPSPANAASYFKDFESWAKAGQRRTFDFEAFDEAWKTASEGPEGATWGVWDQNTAMKYGSDVFSGATVSDNWTCTSQGGGGSPQLQFTFVPPTGSNQYLQGMALHVAAIDYNIVVYIHVGSNGWWVKPYFNAPLTAVNCDGSWTANIVTGGNDADADQIAAFLIPNGYNPPALGGSGSLPQELYNNSVAHVVTSR